MGSSFCWKCHAPYEGQIFFKSLCDRCGAYLHACKGCRHHQVGKPNDCNVPNTEPVRDQEGLNYCEEFKGVSEVKLSEGPSVEDVAKRLFKDE